MLHGVIPLRAFPPCQEFFLELSQLPLPFTVKIQTHVTGLLLPILLLCFPPLLCRIPQEQLLDKGLPDLLDRTGGPIQDQRDRRSNQQKRGRMVLGTGEEGGRAGPAQNVQRTSTDGRGDFLLILLSCCRPANPPIMGFLGFPFSHSPYQLISELGTSTQRQSKESKQRSTCGWGERGWHCRRLQSTGQHKGYEAKHLPFFSLGVHIRGGIP